MKILLGVTGSVATIKLGEILERLNNEQVKIVSTERALHFVPKEVLPRILTDKDEWQVRKTTQV
jgi:phosphopantothenoylcysteine decarboxylase